MVLSLFPHHFVSRIFPAYMSVSSSYTFDNYLVICQSESVREEACSRQREKCEQLIYGLPVAALGWAPAGCTDSFTFGGVRLGCPSGPISPRNSLCPEHYGQPHFRLTSTSVSNFTYAFSLKPSSNTYTPAATPANALITSPARQTTRGMLMFSTQ